VEAVATAAATQHAILMNESQFANNAVIIESYGTAHAPENKLGYVLPSLHAARKDAKEFTSTQQTKQRT